VLTFFGLFRPGFLIVWYASSSSLELEYFFTLGILACLEAIFNSSKKWASLDVQKLGATSKLQWGESKCCETFKLLILGVISPQKVISAKGMKVH